MTKAEEKTGLSADEVAKRKAEFVAELKANIEKHTGFTRREALNFGIYRFSSFFSLLVSSPPHLYPCLSSHRVYCQEQTSLSMRPRSGHYPCRLQCYEESPSWFLNLPQLLHLWSLPWLVWLLPSDFMVKDSNNSSFSHFCKALRNLVMKGSSWRLARQKRVSSIPSRPLFPKCSSWPWKTFLSMTIFNFLLERHEILASSCDNNKSVFCRAECRSIREEIELQSPNLLSHSTKPECWHGDQSIPSHPKYSASHPNREQQILTMSSKILMTRRWFPILIVGEGKELEQE